jgi:hypothetical protein
MSFLNELEKGTNRTARTANGALSNTSTLDPLLDFFANAGAMRGKEKEAVRLFDKAFAVDPQSAVRCLFYLRDIRGGQGERSVFRAILESMSQVAVDKVAKFIPEYGRWDEVPFTTEGLALIKAQLEDDEKNLKANKPVSLLAKWLPSVNTSSKATREKGEQLANLLGLKPRQYRLKLSALRKRINLLESKMSQREWAEIQYDKLPTQAHRKHIKAFRRHDESGYEEYLGLVEKGEKKINSSASFTYEIYDMVRGDYTGENSRTANAMWKSLPDYTNGSNALVLADVSGSMGGRPMSISVSLALYFAERNEGTFKDYFMTFTSRSRLQKVTGNTLQERMNSIEQSEWGGSTNVQSAFDAILDAARKANAGQDEMPKVLYIISDMQFNQATYANNETNFEAAERKFREAGYELPHVVFWNCSPYGNQDAPATKYDNHVTLISGSNQSTFQYAVEGKTPIESMMDVINSDRYAQITL